jgi:general stress protein 26
MPVPRTREEAIQTFGTMVAGIPVAMLTTTGMGRLRSRPMVAQRLPFDGYLWFVTARAAGKTGEIRDRQAVHVTFVSPSDDRYVWASGTAALFDDAAMLKRVWHDGYLPWLRGGPDDPTIELIRVRVEEAEYWDTTEEKMVRLDHFVDAETTFRALSPDSGF